MQREHPAPGRWEIVPNELVSGDRVSIELRYTNGDAALEAGAWFRMEIEPISVKTTLFCPMSDGFEIVALDDESPQVQIEQKPQMAIGPTPVRLVLPGGVQPGSSFALRIGNRSDDGTLTGLVMPAPVHNLAFNIWSGAGDGATELNWFDKGWAADLPRCTIHAAPASALRIFAPSLVQAGTPFTVKVAVTDEFDSAAYPPFEGDVPLGDGVLTFTAADACSRTVENVVLSTPGVHRLTATLGGRSFESNPIVVREQVDVPIYWGLVHGHDWHSECWGDGADNYYRFGRTISGLDYLGLSEHIDTTPRVDNFIGRLHPYRTGERISAREAFLENVRAANDQYRPGEFVTLIGYEMSPRSPLHHNIFWADADEDNFERMFLDAPTVYSEASAANLTGLDALIVPHMHARYVSYNHFAGGEPLIPVVEGYSDWGMAFHPPHHDDELIGGLAEPGRPFYEWVGRGIHVGFVGDSDTHTGLPARRHAGSPSPPPHHFRPQGITAVRTSDLTRHGIIDAYRSRWTYGTSGQRIFLDVRANDARMGEVLDVTEPFVLRVEAAGTDVIERVGIYDPDGVVEERTLGDVREATLDFKLSPPGRGDVPYFVEVVQADHHRAWSSPLWVRDASLPNLSWERDQEGALRLVNAGGSVAPDVVLAHSAREHPFACAPIPYPVPEPEVPYAAIWTHRWDDHRITVFLMWRGAELTGSLTVDGFERYEVEMEPVQAIIAPVDDDSAGRVAFASPNGGNVPYTYWGFNTTVHISHSQPSVARFEFADEAAVHLGGGLVLGTVVEVPLNGICDPAAITRLRVGDLAPGEAWTAPSADGIWAADPDNAITESSESTNLYPAAPATARPCG